MGRRSIAQILMDAQEAHVNAFGIPTDPDAALKALEAGEVKLTEKPNEVTSGVVIEDFSISVKDKESDTVLFEAKSYPFGWTKVDSLAAVFEAEGAELSDEQIAFLSQALADTDTKNNPIGKANKAIIDVYNSNSRANAKGSEYGRVYNLKAPMSEETKGKKIESMVAMFAAINKCSLDMARTKMKEAGLI